MLTYVARRLLFAIPMLLILSIIMFSFMTSTFDPVEALRNPRMTSADVQRIRASMGLDQPPHLQYITWLKNFVTGDWGTSIRFQRPVSDIIGTRLVNTLKLMGVAVTFSFILALLIGVYSAVKSQSLFDYTFTGGSFFGISMPIFWFALIMQLVLGLYLMGWMGDARQTLTFLPDWFGREPLFFTAGMRSPGRDDLDVLDFLRHAALPALALMVQLVAGWGRYERASMLEILGSDYMRTARAKGLKERSVILKHGLRNALIPLVTVTAIDMGALFGGLIITEKIFSWPGMGSLFVDTIQVGDFPIILAWMMVVATFIIVFNLLADIIYGILDPRIRYG